MVVNFTDGGNRSAWRKPLTYRKSLKLINSCNIELLIMYIINLRLLPKLYVKSKIKTQIYLNGLYLYSKFSKHMLFPIGISSVPPVIKTVHCSLCYGWHVCLVPVFRGFEAARSGQTKNKDWLAQNQDNVSEWINMPTRGLLFQ